MKVARGFSSHYTSFRLQIIRRTAALAALLALGLAAPLYAQRGLPPSPSPGLEHRFPIPLPGTRLNGRVTTGEHPAAGANIELQNISTGLAITTSTQEDGSFEFDDVQPGEYLVIASFGANRVQNEMSVTNPAPELHIQMPGTTTETRDAAVSVGELQVSKKARSALENAQKAARHGDTTRALNRLDDALAAAPDFAQALTLRAALRLHSNEVDSALKDAQAAVRADPQYAAGFFVLASVLNRQSQFVDAERAAGAGLQRAPQAWQGHFELGGALEGQNQHAAALKELDLAVQAAPNNFPGVYLLRAITLIRLQQYEAAQKDLREVVHRDPQGPAASVAHNLLTQMNADQEKLAH